jgi:ArsR family transcriptional regulator
MRELAKTPETCACDFTDLFTVAQPTISAHLRTLREAGLVTTRRRGTQICYSIDQPTLDQTLAELHELQPDSRPVGPQSSPRHVKQPKTARRRDSLVQPAA